MLAEHFIERASKKENRPPKPISGTARLMIEDAPWTGNVRELRNAIARAVLDPGDIIEPHHLFADRPGEASTQHETEPKDDDQQAARRLREAVACRGSVYAAARALGIPLSSAYAQAHRSGIEVPPSKGGGRRGRPRKG